MRVKGAVTRVVLRGEVVYVDGEVLAAPGFGKPVYSSIQPYVVTESTTPKPSQPSVMASPIRKRGSIERPVAHTTSRPLQHSVSVSEGVCYLFLVLMFH